MEDTDYRHIAKMGVKGVIILIALFAISIITMQLLEPYIGKKAISKLRAQLKVKSVIDDYRLSIFEDFPKLSLILEGVEINGTDSTSFISASEASIQMNIWDLIGGEYKFKSLKLNESRLNIHVNKVGNGNWNIFKSNNDTSSLSMQWNKVQFKNVTINYSDKRNQSRHTFKIQSGRLSGNLKGDNLMLNPDLDVTIQQIKNETGTYLTSVPLHLSGKLLIDMNNNFYQFKSMQLQFRNSPISVKGTIDLEGKNTYYDLAYQCKNFNIAGIKKLLSPETVRKINHYNFTGTALIHGTYKGISNSEKSASLVLSFMSNNAFLNLPDIKHKIKNITIDGSYKINRFGIDKLKLNTFRGEFADNPFHGEAVINNFSNPTISATFDGVLPMQLIDDFSSQIQILDGAITLHNFSLKNFSPYTAGNKVSHLQGLFSLQKFHFTLNDKKIAVPYLKGELRRDDILIIDSTEILYGNSDVSLRGSVRNLILSLFNADDKKLAFDMKLNSDHLSIDELYRLYQSINAQQVKNVSLDNKKDKPSIFKGITGKFRADIGSFSYDKIHGEAFTGDVFILKNNYKLNGRLLTCDGGVKFTGLLDRHKKMNFEGNFDMQDINIHQLFNQWNNFGQSFIISKHLSGTIDGKAIIDLGWSEGGTFLPGKMDIISSIQITDGNLKDFELLRSFSSYVDVEDLQNIQFKKLQNVLIIRDRNVYIPAMFIQSNAMNLTVNGIHTFDQRIDYNIKINGGQVLMNKFHDQSDVITARRNGWFNLYYTITGDLNGEYDYRRDKKKVLSSFWQSIEMRKRNEAILRKTFPQVEATTEPSEWKDSGNPQLNSTHKLQIIEGF